MKGLRLALNAKYVDRGGIIVTIDRLLDKDKTSLEDDEQSGVFTEAELFEMGYRFKSTTGDSYLPDGRYDINEPDCILDLIDPVSQHYLIIQGKDDTPHLVEAFDPEDAIKNYISTDYGDVVKDTVKAVYQLINVTPFSHKIG